MNPGLICSVKLTNTIFVCSSQRGNKKKLQVKPTGQRPLSRPWRRWENNIRMDLKEIGINVGNWVNSAQGRDYLEPL